MEIVTMNRIMKFTVILYGTIISLILLDLVLILTGIDQSHFLVAILLAFFSISITNRYIKVLKDQEKEEANSNKNKFKLIKNEM